MRKGSRNGRASTKTFVEDEIAQLRGLDLRGIRSRRQGVFGKPAPVHLTRHLLFALSPPIASRRIALAISTTQPGRFSIGRWQTKPTRQCELVWPASTRSGPNLLPAQSWFGNGIDNRNG
jgi:hypothetical protein